MSQDKSDAKKGVGYFFSIDSAIDEGFAYERPFPRKNPIKEIGKIFNGQAKGFENSPRVVRPLLQATQIFGRHDSHVLSPEKRKKLMEESALATPRSTTRAVFYTASRYPVEGSWKERAMAGSLLFMAIWMNKESVEMMADFRDWFSMLTNTVTHLYNHTSEMRPDAINDIIQNYPALQQLLENNGLLDKAMQEFPDVSQILRMPEFQDVISANEGLREVLERNPTMEDLFREFPSFQNAMQDNPALMEQLQAFNNELGSILEADETSREIRERIHEFTYREFLANMTNVGKHVFSPSFLTDNFNATADYFSNAGWNAITNPNYDPNDPETAKRLSFMNWHNMFSENTRNTLGGAWNNLDFTSIVMKFMIFAVASYKATQQMVLRWRGWQTGYMACKTMKDKAYLRMKNLFNGAVDNPGQRLQEDPDKFSTATVSLLTGAATAINTGIVFGPDLVEMGSFMGMEWGYLWSTAAFSAVLLGLTTLAGYKYPEIFRNKQRVEANLRKATDNIDNQANQIALTGSEELELQEMQKRIRPALRNTVREISTSIKVQVVDATFGNASIPFPYLIIALTTMPLGASTMGTIAALNYTFNRVHSSMSFFVNRFEQISAWMATGVRMYQQDVASDAAFYLEQEKRQLSKQLLENKDDGNGGNGDQGGNGGNGDKPPAPQPA